MELTSDENEATHEMHGQRITQGTRVDDGHHRIVIGEKFHLKALPVTTPHDRRHHDRKQLLAKFPKTTRTANGAKADGTGGIRRDKQVGKRTHRWHTAETDPIPGLEKIQPPRQIAAKFPIQDSGECGGMVNERRITGRSCGVKRCGRVEQP